MLHRWHGYNDFPDSLLTTILLMYAFLNFLILIYIEHIRENVERKINHIFPPETININIFPYMSI